MTTIDLKCMNVRAVKCAPMSIEHSYIFDVDGGSITFEFPQPATVLEILDIVSPNLAAANQALEQLCQFNMLPRDCGFALEHGGYSVLNMVPPTRFSLLLLFCHRFCRHYNQTSKRDFSAMSAFIDVAQVGRAGEKLLISELENRRRKKFSEKVEYTH